MSTIVSDNGLIVLDTNCYKYFENPAEREAILRSCRAAQLSIWPSAINVFEAAATPQVDIRDRLLAVIRSLVGARALLPWPLHLIEEFAISAAEGKRTVKFRASLADGILHDPAIALQERDEAVRIRSEIEAGFNQIHTRIRPEIQEHLRAENLRYEWPSVSDFLDKLWMQPELVDNMSELYLTHTNLAGRVPTDVLSRIPAWLLFVEAEGIAAYQRGVVSQLPRRVHRFDLLQLVYLAGSDRRILVTDDGPFLDVAQEVLNGRHPNARAMHISEFLKSSQA